MSGHRLSHAAREAIYERLSTHARPEPVPLTRVLRELRARFPSLSDGDDDLISHIVTAAADNGLAVDFDQGQEDSPGS